MLGVDDARVEGEHAQQGERPEDDEPLPVVVAVDEAEDLLPLLLQDPVVELPMRGAELDGDDLLLLLGRSAATRSFVRRMRNGRIRR